MIIAKTSSTTKNISLRSYFSFFYDLPLRLIQNLDNKMKLERDYKRLKLNIHDYDCTRYDLLPLVSKFKEHYASSFSYFWLLKDFMLQDINFFWKYFFSFHRFFVLF